jgi:hypothetical protein
MAGTGDSCQVRAPVVRQLPVELVRYPGVGVDDIDNRDVSSMADDSRSRAGIPAVPLQQRGGGRRRCCSLTSALTLKCR